MRRAGKDGKWPGWDSSQGQQRGGTVCALGKAAHASTDVSLCPCCALGSVPEHRDSALYLGCSHCSRPKPKKVEDEPARRRSMRLLRVEPVEIPLLETFSPAVAEEYVRWGRAAGGVGAQQLCKTTAGDTAGWHWALHSLRHLGGGDTGMGRKGQFCHPKQVPHYHQSQAVLCGPG